MKLFKIKHRFTGDVLFSGKFSSLRLCVESAVFNKASLKGAFLKGAFLKGAFLKGANLYRASLEGANLKGANLEGANLEWAYLKGASLEWAYLERAYLKGAFLKGAFLKGAFLKGAKNLILPDFMIVPGEGSFIGWKAAKVGDESVIIKLEIPAKAKRTSTLTSRKCRASYVKTLAIYRKRVLLNKKLPKKTVAVNGTYPIPAEYKVGRVTRAAEWDDSPFVECAPGIHFFVTRKEAEDRI